MFVEEVGLNNCSGHPGFIFDAQEEKALRSTWSLAGNNEAGKPTRSCSTSSRIIPMQNWQSSRGTNGKS